MYFVGRDVHVEASKLSFGDLQVGHFYFDLAFCDAELLHPTITTLILVDILDEGERRVAIFENIDSIKVEDNEPDQKIGYSEHSLNTLYAFDGMLEQLMACSLLRDAAKPQKM